MTMPVATIRHPLASFGTPGGHHRVMSCWSSIFHRTQRYGVGPRVSAFVCV